MSSASSLLDSVRAGYAKVAQIEAVVAKHPGDRFVLISLESAKRHVESLEADWAEECRVTQVEVCRYRLISAFGDNYFASSFSKSIIEFQNLFSQIFDAKRGGIKQRARITADAMSETIFCLGYLYPGSLGAVLTVQDTPSLFGGQFDSVIDTFNDITSINSMDEVRDAGKTLGNAVLKRIVDWSRVNYESGYSVDVTWTGGISGRVKGGLIERSALAKIISIIEQTSDVEKKPIEIRGTLVAINTLGRTFRFVVPDGEDFSGPLSKSFDANKEWTVNKIYKAEIEVESIIRYATDKTDQTYTLLRLSN